ncbi:hypothetical protein B0H11DRAFT_1762080 [Mycena galericulata]|nr:hypothetical protein B0H11DRAFT_1762080 [Mycena galericulata]
MLAGTGALISGSTVAALLQPGMFSPGDIDIYTACRRGYDAVKFLLRMGKFSIAKTSTSYDYTAGIRKVWTLEATNTLDGTDAKKINVIESLSDNPFDPLTHFHLTCVVGAWLADGFWHGYPALTSRKVALTTMHQLPLKDDLKQQKHVWGVLQKYTDRGFTIAIGEYDNDHDCGTDANCPATLRSSDDAGCLYTPFPVWPYTGEAQVHAEVCWSFGGTGCTRGILRRSGRTTTPARVTTG